jgi:type VI secretion system protein ImpB
MAESKQHWLDRNRPPRVQITYDVETGGAIEQKEIPFVVGVLSDLSGDNAPQTKLKERKFIQVDRDNFNQFLESTEPKVSFEVPNKLGGSKDTVKVELSPKSIDDFRPEQIVQHVDELKHLFEARQRLNDLLAKLEGNDVLNKALLELLGDDKKLDAVNAVNAIAAKPTGQ